MGRGFGASGGGKGRSQQTSDEQGWLRSVRKKFNKHTRVLVPCRSEFTRRESTTHGGHACEQHDLLTSRGTNSLAHRGPPLTRAGKARLVPLAPRAVNRPQQQSHGCSISGDAFSGRTACRSAQRSNSSPNVVGGFRQEPNEGGYTIALD